MRITVKQAKSGSNLWASHPEQPRALRADGKASVNRPCVLVGTVI